METAIDLIFTFWVDILLLMPDTPFMLLFALAIVLVIANNIYHWIIPHKDIYRK